MRSSRRGVAVRARTALVVATLLFGSFPSFASASETNQVDGTTDLELGSVRASDDQSIPRLTGVFTPPVPGTDRPVVADADANTLFAALANHTVVVVFTVPWCALCVGYAKEFARVADAYQGLVSPKTKTPIVFLDVVVDTDEHKALAKTFGVASVPFVTVLKHKRWYVTKSDGTVSVRKPKRYDGYLGAAPTAQWVSVETGVNVMVGEDSMTGSTTGDDSKTSSTTSATSTVPTSRNPIRPYVHELTNATIDAFVNDHTRDVLLEFYAPWCGHCVEFEPHYFQVSIGRAFPKSRLPVFPYKTDTFLKTRQVGARFAESDSVRVARIDVDKYRDVAAKFNVHGLPSLQLFPKGYKKRGLVFKNAERKPADIISFVKSPQVWLLEATVLDMPQWHCVLWLESKGVLVYGKGSVSEGVGLLGNLEAGVFFDHDGPQPSVTDDEAAAAMFAEAHAWANRGRWLESVEILTCLSHTKPLRNTGIGSSPSMWNFLDNAKMRVENPGVEVGGFGEGLGKPAGGDETVFGDNQTSAAFAIERMRDEATRVNPGGETWESFGGNDGGNGNEEREANGFDWEAWETFVTREAGDGYGEVREIGDS
jgi:thiol-disulfide isomerase/thioredoxin